MATYQPDKFIDVVKDTRTPAGVKRPVHVPTPRTRKFVKRMCQAGIPQAAIAELLDISPQTLSVHYPVETKASNDAIQRVAAVLFRKALDGDTTAAIFWLKARAGWRDRDATQVNVQANVVTPSREQLDLEQDMIGKIEQLRPLSSRLDSSVVSGAHTAQVTVKAIEHAKQ